jgi:hydrogenase nickel incorporation protein HypB
MREENPMKVNVMSDILKANDLLARDIENILRDRKIVSWNVMGSPGAGKTALLETLIPMLPDGVKSAVIEGDLATSNDAERIAKTGVQSAQINTNGACHLDAAMVRSAVDTLNLDGISLLFIENVGNLVCPSSFALGENGRILVSSITEGDDKPEKYPSMFKTADLVVLNKMDLRDSTNFKMETFKRGMDKTNPRAELILVSAVDKSGFDKLLGWVLDRL